MNYSAVVGGLPGLDIVDRDQVIAVSRGFWRNVDLYSRRSTILALSGSTTNALVTFFFWKMTANDWAVIAYKHTDHHLRQFGV